MSSGAADVVELRSARRARRLRFWLRRGSASVLGLLALAGVVVLLNPQQVGRALLRFNLGLLPAILLLYVLLYALQGARWHGLLRETGARLKLSDSLLLNAAGQAITALVPLGDLTRALFAAQASGQSFGKTAATVTVQELSFTLMLVLLALPVVMTLHLGVWIVVTTVIGMAAVVAILTVSRVFCTVHSVIARIPLMRRLLPAIHELHHGTADLLHRPQTLGWSVLDLVRAGAAVTIFWLLVQGAAPNSLTWTDAAFVFAVSTIGGAISLIPGGVGANEAGVAGLLILFGVHPGPAGAVALIQRALMTGIALVFGYAAYRVERPRFRLGGLFQVTTRHERGAAAAA
jgi:glycosyltransferase 2 family protein